MSALSRYDESLREAPARGAGLHQHVMRVSCLGVLAELPAEVIIRDLYALDGIKRNEPEDAVKKAFRDVQKDIDWQPEQQKPTNFEDKEENALDKFIKGVDAEMMDLIELSPFRLLHTPDQDGYELLNALYKPDEYLFIGDIFDRDVKQVKDWLSDDLTQYPHIIPNPMTGKEGLTDQAKISYRCENTVADMRFAVCEMDTVTLADQVKFWVRCIELDIPVSAVIHSGKKSLHGWVKVDCGQDDEKWEKDVRGWFFKEFGARYGIDTACQNKARLSRLAGHLRGNNQLQRVLYLNGGV